MQNIILYPKSIDIETLKAKALLLEFRNVTIYSKKEACLELERLHVHKSYLKAIFIQVKVYGKVKYIKYPNSETVISLIHKVDFYKSGEKDYPTWLSKRDVIKPLKKEDVVLKD